MAAADRFMMGEVIVDRALLSRMGLRDGGQNLNATGAYLHLRFDPDTLESLLRGGSRPNASRPCGSSSR